jgi:hypothetical protein
MDDLPGRKIQRTSWNRQGGHVPSQGALCGLVLNDNCRLADVALRPCRWVIQQMLVHTKHNTFSLVLKSCCLSSRLSAYFVGLSLLNQFLCIPDCPGSRAWWSFLNAPP